MKPKHQRLIFVLVSVAFLCVATLFALQAFRENLVFFYTPSDLTTRTVDSETLVRIGGMVESGSVRREGDQLFFRLTDGAASLDIHYQGIPPTLFREGQGAVVEGYVSGTAVRAARILTKHDEYYMPKDVAEKLKKSGRWKGHETP